MKRILPFLMVAVCPVAATAQNTGGWTLHKDMLGENKNDFGNAVLRPAGDVDGDGVPDVISGAWISHNSGIFSGTVLVYSGATNAIIHRLQGHASYESGAAVLAAGDVNFDGYDDFWIGSPGISTVSLHSGADASVIYHVRGENQQYGFGRSLLRTADHDGDGVDDFIVGDSGWQNTNLNSTGRMSVFSTATGAWIQDLAPLRNSSFNGTTMADCGDLDGDSVNDFASLIRIEQEIALVVYSNATLSEIMRIQTESFGQHVTTIADAGDLNHDGWNDIAVGAPDYYVGGGHKGKVWLFSGVNGDLLSEMHGHRDLAGFGAAILGNVDVNMDGYSDLIISAPFYSLSVAQIFVYSGHGGGEIGRYTSDQIGDSLGSSMTAVGDLDHDGYTEIALAMPGYRNPETGYSYGGICIADFDL